MVEGGVEEKERQPDGKTREDRFWTSLTETYNVNKWRGQCPSGELHIDPDTQKALRDNRQKNSCHKKRRGKLKSHFPRPVKGKRFINPCHILPVGITPFSYATNLIKVTSTSRLSQDKGDRFCCSSLPTSQHIAAIWFIFRVSSEQCGVLFFTAPGDIFKVPWENEGE